MSALSASRLLVGVALLWGACSIVVEPRTEPLRCIDAGVLGLDSGANPCPDDLTCFNGVCTKCLDYEICGDGIDNNCNGRIDKDEGDESERCDGIDNDCDGEIDEAFEFDKDRDGVRWCGLQNEAETDCDDSNPEKFPGNPEVCDGLDNDCDGLTDNAPPGRSLCASGSKCDPIAAKCVPLNCETDPTRVQCKQDETCLRGRCERLSPACAQCRATEQCVDERCVPRPRLANGSGCIVDEDCASNVCVDAEALRLSEPERVCVQACCTDSQCGEGERCYAAGTGARSCMPIDKYPPDRESIKQCTGPGQCETRSECQLYGEQALPAPTFSPALSDVVTPVCRAPRAELRGFGEPCTQLTVPNSCSSGVCVSGVLAGSLCSIPCGRSSDCRALSERLLLYRVSAYCRYVPLPVPSQADAGRPRDYASVCVLGREYEVGEGNPGDPCTRPQECKERGCIGAGANRPGQCTAACCADSHCASSGRSGICRPFKVGMGYEMRCEPSSLRQD